MSILIRNNESQMTVIQVWEILVYRIFIKDKHLWKGRKEEGMDKGRN